MDFQTRFEKAAEKALAGRGPTCKFERIESNKYTYVKVTIAVNWILTRPGSGWIPYSGVALGVNDGLKDDQVIFEVT